MSARLVIFAREPVPGRVKTRLAETIDAVAAASVYSALLEHTVTTARATAIETTISVAEEPRREWTETLDLPMEIQGRGDLGRRMAECFRRRFGEGAARVVIIGSDNALLQPEHLRSAFAALDEDLVVLGPADDGGYWLVGQRAPGLDLFSGIPWSSPETLDSTRARLVALGTEWSELETLPDIDAVEDLQKAIEDPRIDRDLRRRLGAALKPLDAGRR